MPKSLGFELPTPCPLLAESGPLFSPFSSDVNVRYGEKRSFRNDPKIFTILTNLERPLSTRKRPLS
jgi:hypothetical protein